MCIVKLVGGKRRIIFEKNEKGSEGSVNENLSDEYGLIIN
jgi:hypothetical protein